MKLNGKSVVVTGASSGMGKAIVERFAKEGANIIAVALRKERLERMFLYRCNFFSHLCKYKDSPANYYFHVRQK